MPKSRAPDSLDRLVASACGVFAERGFRRTQVADVARAMGASVGTVYNLVDGKEALFHLCLVATSPAEPGLPDGPLPFPRPSPDATREVVRDGFAALGEGFSLFRAARSEAPDDVAAELADIIGGLFDRTARSAEFQRLVERSAADLPALFEEFFRATRRPALSNLASYLERRIASGHLRPVPDVAAAARLVLEAQAWFARHRRFDLDAGDVTEEAGRATVIDVLVAGLVA